MKPDKQRISLNDIPGEERPRERLMRYGPGALSTGELLAILLRTGTRDENVLHLAQRVLTHFEDLPGLQMASVEELIQIRGLGQAKAAQILAAIELGNRLANHIDPARRRVENAADAARLVMDMGNLTQEHIRVILLNNMRQVITIPTLYIGTVNTSILRISEIFREAIIRNSPAIILAHNHPSGEAAPSPEDIELTRVLIRAGKLLDIQVIDHIIIGRGQWRSIRRMGLLFEHKDY